MFSYAPQQRISPDELLKHEFMQEYVPHFLQ
jgi:hypothetical protein